MAKIATIWIPNLNLIESDDTQIEFLLRFSIVQYEDVIYANIYFNCSTHREVQQLHLPVSQQASAIPQMRHSFMKSVTSAVFLPLKHWTRPTKTTSTICRLLVERSL